MNTYALEWQQTCCSITSKLPGVVYRCLHDNERTVQFIGGNYAYLIGYKDLTCMSEIIHPSHVERVLAEIEIGLQQGEFCSIEYPIRTSLGEEKWVLDQVTGVFDPITHKLIATEGMLMDITQRKQREGQLELYSFLIDQTNDPIFVINSLSGKLLSVNTKACDSLGYSHQELIKLHVYDIEVMIPDERAWESHAAAVKETHFVAFQGYHKRKNGNVFPVEVNLKYIEDKGNPYMVAVVRDISERLEAQKKLQISDDRFNLLSKASQDVIYDWDLNDNTVWWSDSLDKIAGSGIDRKKFGFKQWCEHIHPDDKEWVLESLNQKFFNKETQWVGEYRFRDGEGNYRYVFDRGYIIYRDEVLHRMVGAMQDITERKTQEAKLRERIVYEHLVNGLCFDFINCQVDEVDDLINDSLRAVGEFIKADRSYVFLISEDESTLSNTHEWSRVEPQKDKWQKLPMDRLGWWIKAFVKFKAINVPRIDDLPSEAIAFRELLEERGIRSFLLMPMYSRGKLKGILGFDSVLERNWDENDTAMLNIISTVFTNAIVKRKNERALIDNERYLSQLIEGSPVAIFVKDADGKYIVSNKVFAGFFNTTPEELKGKNDIEIGIPPELIEDIRSKDMMVMESDNSLPPYELRLNSPQTGNMHTVEIIKVPVKRDNSPQVLGIGIDITARKLAEEKLQKERDFSENLISTANVMIIGLDLQGRVLIFNKEAEKITGYSAGEIRGRSFFESVVPSQKYNDAYKRFLDFSMHGKLETNEEGPLITKDGEERFISWRNMPLSEGNDVIGVISFGIDISEKRIAEQKFREQYLELEKINKELDRFVYSASHDLKAPLSSILGLINVARMEDLSESQSRYFDMIEKNISRLNGFIFDIINYSRNARTDLVKNKIDLNSLIKGTIEDLQFMNGLDKIRISYEVNDPVPFYSDEGRLKVILNNLLSNAINYHLLTRVDPYINITVIVNKEQMVMKVADNGQGIKKEYLPKIFDMFYRASDNSKGSGLGLYILKEIVTRMRGDISVESHPMKGSTFTVTLPNMVK